MSEKEKHPFKLETYKKPNGSEIQINILNPANVQLAEKLGWKKVGK